MRPERVRCEWWGAQSGGGCPTRTYSEANMLRKTALHEPVALHALRSGARPYAARVTFSMESKAVACTAHATLECHVRIECEN